MTDKEQLPGTQAGRAAGTEAGEPRGAHCSQWAIDLTVTWSHEMKPVSPGAVTTSAHCFHVCWPGDPRLLSHVVTLLWLCRVTLFSPVEWHSAQVIQLMYRPGVLGASSWVLAPLCSSYLPLTVGFRATLQHVSMLSFRGCIRSYRPHVHYSSHLTRKRSILCAAWEELFTGMYKTGND